MIARQHHLERGAALAVEQARRAAVGFGHPWGGALGLIMVAEGGDVTPQDCRVAFRAWV